MRYFFLDKIGKNIYDGSQSHRLELMSNLSQLSNEILVPTPNENLALKWGVKPVNISYRKGPNSWIAQIYKFLNESKNFNPDIIYSRNFGSALIGSFISGLRNSIAVFEVNGIQSDEIRYTYSKVNKLRVNYITIMEKLAIKRSDVVIVVTPWIKKYFINKGINPKKLYVIQNGVNTSHFNLKPHKDINNLRKKLNISFNDPIIVYSGSLLKYQGIDVLIKAAPIILRHFKNTKFLIVGTGPLKKSFLKMARDLKIEHAFRFVGFIKYEDLPSYISMATICVVLKRPLISGYSPLKLYEYMACEKPIVASNERGLTILTEIGAGVNVKENIPNEVAKAILFILHDKNKAEKMGKKGREYILKHHNWKKIAKRINQICVALL